MKHLCASWASVLDMGGEIQSLYEVCHLVVMIGFDGNSERMALRDAAIR